MGQKEEGKGGERDEVRDLKRALVAFLKREQGRKGEGKGDKRPPPTGFPEEDKREEGGDRRKPKGDRKGERKDDGPTGEPDVERRQEPTGETPREGERQRGDKQEKEDLAEIAKLVKEIMKRRQQA